ncbi:MAG TPA: 50S ribosomal protein L6 [Dokdonella sp.]|uniref:Large ribosomal subunit protein uL6 n=1 Tax=Rhodanobacter denitrificans TaxID=666685 RepID=A0A2W5K2S9_9GAMM|nr:50S ribosomal protein L6 [Dokdonella sp.]PZQ09405.1 MAG: 50S ribosomal protein L6 [Rhodanobacter denitrificans]HUD41618.1 50S ribosomal protein L6 [Dokdonella sp.]
MSRVAKKPISLPKGVECKVESGTITVKGPKGTLTFAVPAGVDATVEAGVVQFSAREQDDIKLAGTARALVNSMVIGVSEGFQRKLELVGVGYRAALQGKDLNLSLGFSHPILFKAPEGVTIEVPSQTEILIKGADKQSVGQVAAKIRAFRPPEPYKGKGVRYSGEQITLKEAKKA